MPHTAISGSAPGVAPVRPLRRRAAASVIPPALNSADTAAASVFAAVRRRGPLARDTVAAGTGLSVATVNRQVSALLDAGLLRERPDLAVPGAIGRPRIPVEVNSEPYLALGVHIGARSTSIVATDLLGRTLDAVETATPAGPAGTALPALADSARRYLRRWHRRRPLWVGVATGGVVDIAAGLVDHPRLGWSQAPVGPVLAAALGLPVSLAPHVDAMAGAELLLGAPADARSSLYVYARETVGFAQVIDGRVHIPAGGPGTMAGLPVRSGLLGDSGQLESTVSDEAVVAAARRDAILPAAGPHSSIEALLGLARRGHGGAADRARALLTERARVLGEAVALLRDLLSPDDLVVGGQAFTGYPEALPDLAAAFSTRSLLGAREIRLTAFGNRVQEAGAGVVSLSRLYADPIGALRRSVHRRVPA